jgi:hypothetical protein
LTIGYITIPEDWTEDNYQLVETLDSTENEHNTAWNDTLAKLNTHTEIHQYAIVPPSKGAGKRIPDGAYSKFYIVPLLFCLL